MESQKKLLQEASKMIDEEDFEKLLSFPRTLENANAAMVMLGEALQPLTKYGQDYMIKQLCLQSLNIDIEPGNEFQKLRDEAFKMLDKDDYENLQSNPGLQRNAEVAMKETHDELKLMMSDSALLHDALQHLSTERQTQIKTSLCLQSFNAKIEKSETDGSIILKFASLDWKPLSFAPQEVELSHDNYAENRLLLAARIILEIFMLPLDLIGYSGRISDGAKGKAIEKIMAIIQKDETIYTYINAMAEANKQKSTFGVATAIAKCLLYLFKHESSASFGVVKALLSDLSWYKIPILIAKLAVFLVYVRKHPKEVVARIVSLLKGSKFLSKLSQWDEFNNLQLAE